MPGNRITLLKPKVRNSPKTNEIIGFVDPVIDSSLNHRGVVNQESTNVNNKTNQKSEDVANWKDDELVEKFNEITETPSVSSSNSNDQKGQLDQNKGGVSQVSDVYKEHAEIMKKISEMWCRDPKTNSNTEMVDESNHIVNYIENKRKINQNYEEHSESFKTQNSPSLLIEDECKKPILNRNISGEKKICVNIQSPLPDHNKPQTTVPVKKSQSQVCRTVKLNQKNNNNNNLKGDESTGEEHKRREHRNRETLNSIQREGVKSHKRISDIPNINSLVCNKSAGKVPDVKGQKEKEIMRVSDNNNNTVIRKNVSTIHNNNKIVTGNNSIHGNKYNKSLTTNNEIEARQNMEVQDIQVTTEIHQNRTRDNKTVNSKLMTYERSSLKPLGGLGAPDVKDDPVLHSKLAEAERVKHFSTILREHNRRLILNTKSKSIREKTETMVHDKISNFYMRGKEKQKTSGDNKNLLKNIEMGSYSESHYLEKRKSNDNDIRSIGRSNAIKKLPFRNKPSGTEKGNLLKQKQLNIDYKDARLETNSDELHRDSNIRDIRESVGGNNNNNNNGTIILTEENNCIENNIIKNKEFKRLREIRDLVHILTKKVISIEKGLKEHDKYTEHVNNISQKIDLMIE